MTMEMDKGSSSQLRVSRKARILIYFTMILAAVIVLLPLIWLLFSSLKTQEELTRNVWSFPRKLYIQNYINAWTRGRMGTYMLNSLISTIVTIIGTIVTSVTLSFILARFNFKLNRLIFYIVIAGMMIPIHSAVIPLYIMHKDLNLQNNLIALGITYAAFRISPSVFILESFMRSIPKELEESAILDGCGIWRLFTTIIVPLSKDAIISIVILAVLACWNELLVSMLLISEPFIKTLPIGLMGFITEYNAEYTQLCAGLVVACLPSLLFYAILQEKIIKGMTVGALKG
ncbi:MAG: carbohydrate ABC transporter permease [Clostridiaceae bacterium]|nr:carbohydrate ABC transporter permease [Clostridiaceae bacterium]